MRPVVCLLVVIAHSALCVNALPTSLAQCGSGSGACPWSTGGGQLCCSSKGTCGDIDPFCGKGCQYRYGRCYSLLQALASPQDTTQHPVVTPSAAPSPTQTPSPAAPSVASPITSKQRSASPNAALSPAEIPQSSPGVVASPNASKQPQQTPGLPQYQEVNVMGASDVTVYGRRMLSSA